jgi:hypothetical protein
MKKNEYKEKYLKITWNGLLIEKLELVDQNDPCSFHVRGFLPTIENIVQILNECRKDYVFEHRQGDFLTATKVGETNGLSVQYVSKGGFIEFHGDGLRASYVSEHYTSSINVVRDILKIFAMRSKQKETRAKLKEQLSYMGYEPDKVKKESVQTLSNGKQVLYLKVLTKHGRLSMTVDESGCSLRHIDHTSGCYAELEKIEEKIAHMKKELADLEALKDTFMDVNSEIGNCAVVYDFNARERKKNT